MKPWGYQDPGFGLGSIPVSTLGAGTATPWVLALLEFCELFCMECSGKMLSPGETPAESTIKELSHLANTACDRLEQTDGVWLRKWHSSVE